MTFVGLSHFTHDIRSTWRFLLTLPSLTPHAKVPKCLNHIRLFDRNRGCRASSLAPALANCTAASRPLRWSFFPTRSACAHLWTATDVVSCSLQWNVLSELLQSSSTVNHTLSSSPHRRNPLEAFPNFPSTCDPSDCLGKLAAFLYHLDLRAPQLGHCLPPCCLLLSWSFATPLLAGSLFWCLINLFVRRRGDFPHTWRESRHSGGRGWKSPSLFHMPTKHLLGGFFVVQPQGNFRFLVSTVRKYTWRHPTCCGLRWATRNKANMAC